MKILLSGCCGHMGKEVARTAAELFTDADIIAGVDAMKDNSCSFPVAASFDEADTSADVIIDFSHHSLTKALLDFAVKNEMPLVLATTGQTDEEREAIMNASKKIPLFFTSNYSMGVALLIEMAKKVAAAMPGAEIEIIEKHHDRKVDAPSGTALSIAKAIQTVRENATIVTGRSGDNTKRTKEEIGICSVRMGNIVGEHEVLIGTPNQTISLKHEAHSRALFAEGAIQAAQFLITQGAGLYTMDDLVSF